MKLRFFISKIKPGSAFCLPTTAFWCINSRKNVQFTIVLKLARMVEEHLKSGHKVFVAFPWFFW
jgi:hypothetical protein